MPSRKNKGWVGLLLGIPVASLVTLLFLLVFTAIALRQSDPRAHLTLMARTAVLAGAFAGGFSTEKMTKGTPLPTGLVSGALFALAALTVSFFFEGSVIGRVLLVGSVTFVSVIGALSAKKRKTVRRRRRRR